MDNADVLYITTIAILTFTSIYLLVIYASAGARAWLGRQERRFDEVLNHQLLLEVSPRVAMAMTVLGGVAVGLVVAVLLHSVVFFVIAFAVMAALPPLVFNHLEETRRKRLDEQIVDGVTALASGVRAGLTLVQSMQLVVRNHTGPLKQEFQQLLREYDLGIDLHAAMQNSANRIGSSYYRLLFAAVQAHRSRGGDLGQSLDRIADAIREIQRLEGRLQALTAEGRHQAYFMGAMPFIFAVVLYLIMPEEMSMLVTEPIGRLLLMAIAAMIVVAFVWIRNIMAVDI